MGKSEIRTNRISAEDKTLKGLQDMGLIDFECPKCNKSLLTLQVVAIEGSNEVEILTRVGVKCRMCESFSCIQQISGQFYPGAPNDQMVFDVLNDDTGAPEVDVLFEAWNK